MKGDHSVELEASYSLNLIKTKEVVDDINQVAGRWGIASSKAIC